MTDHSRQKKPEGNRFINLLSRYEKGLTNRQKKVCIYIFFVSMSLYFLALLINPFIARDIGRDAQGPLRQRMSTPLDVTLPDSLNMKLIKQRQTLQKLKDSSKAK